MQCVDSNYPTNIAQFTQGLNSTAHQLSIVGLNITTMPAYSIGVGVSDMNLYLCITNKENPVNESRLLYVRQTLSQIPTITSPNDSFSL